MKLFKGFLALVLSLGIVFSSVPYSYADETGELILKLLVKKGVITENELNEIRSEVGKEKKRAERVAPKGLGDKVAKLEDKAEASSWAEKIKLKGDVRFRHEILWDNDTTTGNRERVRARLALKGKVNDKIDAGVRIASGNSSSPTSTNQTLRNTFESKPLWLDWAYINYKPWDWASVKAGAFKNPFMHTELLWDSDVSFAGAVVQVHKNLESEILPPTKIFANIGEFPIDELGASTDDPWLFVYQGGYKSKITKDLSFDLAGTYYQYVNVMGWDVDNATGGNTLDLDGVQLGKDFNIIDITSKITLKDPFKQIGIKNVAIPALILYDDVAVNVDGSDKNWAYMLGAKIGHPKVNDKGKWSADFNYRYIQADAQLDAFPDADFHGGTNAEGVNLILKYGLLKNTVLAAEWYYTEAIDSAVNDDYDSRLQLDAVVKF